MKKLSLKLTAEQKFEIAQISEIAWENYLREKHDKETHRHGELTTSEAYWYQMQNEAVGLDY